MLHSGYDYFTTQPGAIEGILCKVCGFPCKVDRNRKGPLSYAAALAVAAGHSEYVKVHDAWECPNHDEPWHFQLYQLLELAEKTPSPTLKKIYERDYKKLFENSPVSVDKRLAVLRPSEKHQDLFSGKWEKHRTWNKKFRKALLGKTVRIRGKRKTAKIISFYDTIKGGVFLDRNLEGLKGWNLDALEFVEEKK